MTNQMRSTEPDCFCGLCPECRRALSREERRWATAEFNRLIPDRLPRSPFVTTLLEQIAEPPQPTPPKPEKTRDAAKGADGAAEGPRHSATAPRRRAKGAPKLEGDYRQRRRAGRIMLDGHWVHPSPKVVHGTATAVRGWGCYCEPCREYNRLNSQDKRARQNKRREADGA